MRLGERRPAATKALCHADSLTRFLRHRGRYRRWRPRRSIRASHSTRMLHCRTDTTPFEMWKIVALNCSALHDSSAAVPSRHTSCSTRHLSHFISFSILSLLTQNIVCNIFMLIYLYYIFWMLRCVFTKRLLSQLNCWLIKIALWETQHKHTKQKNNRFNSKTSYYIKFVYKMQIVHICK